MIGWLASRAAAITVWSVTYSGRSSILPRLIRETSEQIVDQAHHLRDLPGDDRAALLLHFRLIFRELHQLERIADRGERIAELVGKRGEKLVLAVVGGAELFVELGILHGDGGHVGELGEDRFIVFGERRRPAGRRAASNRMARRCGRSAARPGRWWAARSTVASTRRRRSRPR